MDRIKHVTHEYLVQKSIEKRYILTHHKSIYKILLGDLFNRVHNGVGIPIIVKADSEMPFEGEGLVEELK